MAELTVPQVDFSGLASLPQVYRDARTQAARQQTLAELGSGAGGLDYSTAAKRLLAAGDVQGAMTLAGLGNNERDFQFRQQESQRNQSNADRSYLLQKQQADEAARGFDYREVDDGQGGKTLIRINKATGKTEKVQVDGQQTAPNNPFTYGKMTETESKDAGYANRMFQSEGILRDPKLIQASQSMIDRAADRLLPGDVANKFVTSDAYQKYDQAARDFINATLRRESGAAISQSEFDNAYKQYLPRPGDSQEVLLQKQKNRQATIASIAGGGGRNYKPPAAFGPNGEMIPSGNAGQGVVQPRATPPVTVAPVPQQPAATGPVRITSPAERDALPPGTSYIAPDGSLRTKQ